MAPSRVSVSLTVVPCWPAILYVTSPFLFIYSVKDRNVQYSISRTGKFLANLVLPSKKDRPGFLFPLSFHLFYPYFLFFCPKPGYSTVNLIFINPNTFFYID